MQAEPGHNLISHWMLTGKWKEGTTVTLQHPYWQSINEKLDEKKPQDENFLTENVMLPLPLACTVANIEEESDQIQTTPQKIGTTWSSAWTSA